jgi:hypothetical protein
MKQSKEYRIMGCKANLSIQEKIPLSFVFQSKGEKSFAIRRGRRSWRRQLGACLVMNAYSK